MRRPVIVAIAVLLALAGCGGDDDAASTTSTVGGTGTSDGTPTSGTDHDHDDHASSTTAFAVDAATGTMRLRLRDHVFVDVPATIKGPRVVIDAANDGPSAHEVQITDEDGSNYGAIPPLTKGKSGSMAIELPPGTYTMECLIDLGDGETHADKGMTATFVVEQ